MSDKDEEENITEEGEGAVSEETERNAATWQAPEYAQKERSPDWFWAVGIITVAIFLSAVMLQNLLFGIFALLAGGSTIMFAKKNPDMVEFGLTTRGLYAGDTFYPYTTLKSFWVISDLPEPKILFKSNKTLVPQIIIPLGDADPDYIRGILKEYVEEELQEEPLPHTLMDKIGF